MFQIGLKFIFIFLIFLTGTSEIIAQENYYLTKDLKPEWLITDRDGEKLLPYIPGIHREPSVIHFFLSPGRYMYSDLRLFLPERTGIFINNSIIDYTESNININYRIDSLNQVFDQDSILISLYTNNDISGIRTVITTEKKLDVLFSENSFLRINQLERPVILEFMKIAILLVLLMYALLINNSRKIFVAYHNISNTFSRISTDEFMNRSASLTGVDLLYFATLSVLMSFFSLIIIYHQELEVVMEEISSVTKPMFNWILLLGVMFIWYMLRVFLITVVADLFQIRELKTVHIYEFLRINSFFCLITFVIVVLGLFVFKMDLEFLGRIITRIILWFSVFRMLIISLKFLNSRTYKKLYLFTYLCISEFIPVIIGLKYLLKSSYIQYII